MKLSGICIFTLVLTGNLMSEVIWFDFGEANDPEVVQAGYTSVVSYPVKTVGVTLDLDLKTHNQTLNIRDRKLAHLQNEPLASLLRDLHSVNHSKDPLTFTLTGLKPNTEYTVIGYAVDMFGASTNDNKSVKWTTNGGSVQHTTDSINVESARFQMANLIADSSGTATIVAQYIEGGAAIVLWNGFELEPVGEATFYP